MAPRFGRAKSRDSADSASPTTRTKPALLDYLPKPPDVPATCDALCGDEAISEFAMRAFASQEVGE